MKDLTYKCHTLAINELPNFYSRDKIYRGTSTIDSKEWIRDSSSIECIIGWFKSKVDNLYKGMTFEQVCKEWGGNWKKLIYKDRPIYLDARKRVKDNRVVYLGGFYTKDGNYNSVYRTIESIHYDKVVSKFEKFVDEYCTDWKYCNSISYNGYELRIKEDVDKQNFFGTCKIHKNSTFKCISKSYREIEEKFIARINQIIHHKELAQGVSFEVEGIAGRKPFYYRGYTLWVYKSHNIYYGDCRHSEIMYEGRSSIYTALVADFKQSIDTKVSESWSDKSKKERIKDLEKQLANLSAELEKVKNEKEILVYKGVVLEYGRDPAIREGWMAGRIKNAPIEAETFYAMSVNNMKDYFEKYIDNLEKSAKIYYQLMGLEYKESISTV